MLALKIVSNCPQSVRYDTGLHLLYGNNLLRDLNTCKIPTLFLSGTRDRTIGPESLRQAASLMPDARFELVPGASHALFISHEEKFLDIIREFLPAIILKALA